MVVPPRRKRLILPVAPLAGGIVGLCTAGMFASLPTGLLESMVVDSGVASALSAAEPPLGLTARAVLVLLCGGGAGLAAWFALFLAFGTRSVVLQRSARNADAAPVLRRADAHPDAPPRRPLFANRDLGTPFLDVRAKPVAAPAPPQQPLPEQPLPKDLDQPIAAFDPGALPQQPRDGFPPPAQIEPNALRRPVFDPSERMETFALAPTPQPAPAPWPIAPPPQAAHADPRPDPSVTIHELLDRLERSVTRREVEATSAPEPKLEDTLSTLRKLATRG